MIRVVDKYMVIWFAIYDLLTSSGDCSFIARENCIEVFSGNLVSSVVLKSEGMLCLSNLEKKGNIHVLHFCFTQILSHMKLEQKNNPVVHEMIKDATRSPFLPIKRHFQLFKI